MIACVDGCGASPSAGDRSVGFQCARFSGPARTRRSPDAAHLRLAEHEPRGRQDRRVDRRRRHRRRGCWRIAMYIFRPRGHAHPDAVAARDASLVQTRRRLQHARHQLAIAERARTVVDRRGLGVARGGLAQNVEESAGGGRVRRSVEDAPGAGFRHVRTAGRSAATSSVAVPGAAFRAPAHSSTTVRQRGRCARSRRRLLGNGRVARGLDQRGLDRPRRGRLGHQRLIRRGRIHGAACVTDVVIRRRACFADNDAVAFFARARAVLASSIIRACQRLACRGLGHGATLTSP